MGRAIELCMGHDCWWLCLVSLESHIILFVHSGGIAALVLKTAFVTLLGVLCLSTLLGVIFCLALRRRDQPTDFPLHSVVAKGSKEPLLGINGPQSTLNWDPPPPEYVQPLPTAEFGEVPSTWSRHPTEPHMHLPCGIKVSQSAHGIAATGTEWHDTQYRVVSTIDSTEALREEEISKQTFSGEGEQLVTTWKFASPVLECGPEGLVRGVEIELPYSYSPTADRDGMVVVMRGTRASPHDESAPCRGVLWEPVPSHIVTFGDNNVRIKVDRFSLYAVRIFEIAVSLQVAARFTHIDAARTKPDTSLVVAKNQTQLSSPVDNRQLVDSLVSRGWGTEDAVAFAEYVTSLSLTIDNAKRDSENSRVYWIQLAQKLKQWRRGGQMSAKRVPTEVHKSASASKKTNRTDKAMLADALVACGWGESSDAVEFVADIDTMPQLVEKLRRDDSGFSQQRLVSELEKLRPEASVEAAAATCADPATASTHHDDPESSPHKQTDKQPKAVKQQLIDALVAYGWESSDAEDFAADIDTMPQLVQKVRGESSASSQKRLASQLEKWRPDMNPPAHVDAVTTAASASKKTNRTDKAMLADALVACGWGESSDAVEFVADIDTMPQLVEKLRRDDSGFSQQRLVSELEKLRPEASVEAAAATCADPATASTHHDDPESSPHKQTDKQPKAVKQQLIDALIVHGWEGPQAAAYTADVQTMSQLVQKVKRESSAYHRENLALQLARRIGVGGRSSSTNFAAAAGSSQLREVHAKASLTPGTAATINTPPLSDCWALSVAKDLLGFRSLAEFAAQVTPNSGNSHYEGLDLTSQVGKWRRRDRADAPGTLQKYGASVQNLWALAVAVTLLEVSELKSDAEARGKFQPCCMYMQLTKIASGSFGQVYKGLAKGTTEWFALKRQMAVNKSQDKKALEHGGIPRMWESQIQRFRGLMHEMNIYLSSTLNNPASRHLACLHDFALVRNSHGQKEPLLVFELADAPCTTLKQWMESNDNPGTSDSTQQRLSFAIQMFAGCDELHNGMGAGTDQPLYVHQDLKGENMLLYGDVKRGLRMRLALTDFGLAMQYNSKTARVIHGGNIAHRAPEQWLLQPARGPGRDVWALALVVARLFAVKPTPYDYLQKYWSACEAYAKRYRAAKKGQVKHLSIQPMLHRAKRLGEEMVHSASRSRSQSICVAKLLQRCFVEEQHRPSAADCKKELVRIWDTAFSSSPWSEYEKHLQPRRCSPYTELSDSQRKTLAREFYQDFVCYMLARKKAIDFVPYKTK